MDEIFIISTDQQTNEAIEKALQGYNLIINPYSSDLLDRIYSSPPVLIIFNYDDTPEDIISVMRDDPIFRHLPIILLLDREKEIKDWNIFPVDDFLYKPLSSRELVMRINLCIHRSRRVVETNPLTMLPGNTPIIKEVQRRLDASEEFALAYADLDNFKPFNDKYGFSRGDEVIRMTGRLITNMVKLYDPEKCFVGHIGGDDFVFIVSPDKIKPVCEEITENFNRIIPSFYDPEDRDRGYIISTDRTGVQKRFPLLSISIGVTINRGWFKHYGAISTAATEAKRYAKKFEGSIYFVDRRSYRELS